MNETKSSEWRPAPSEYRTALNLYSKMMEEAKLRLESVDLALSGTTGLIDGAVREFCFLQLRLLCELIAPSCLAAHGDLETVQKLRKTYRKEYAADRIIAELQKLHPEFYPRAVRQTKSGPGTYNAITRRDGFLAKQELTQLYGRCGAVLHRGSFRGLFLKNRYKNFGFAEIKEWKNKMETLLAYHLILMADNKTFVLFTLRNKANKDRVQWISFETKDAVSFMKDDVEVTIESWTQLTPQSS